MIRRLLTGATLVGVLAVAGCPSTTTTTPKTTTTSTSTSTSTTGPSGQKDCGTWFAAAGWPTTFVPSPMTYDCIVAAFSSGESARFTVREQTDGSGGHIRITTYEVVGVRSVRVTVDARGAQPAGGVTVQVCGDLRVSSFPPVLAPGACSS